MVGKKIKCIQPSKHAGHSGIVVKDFDTMLVIKVDDETYSECWNMTEEDSSKFREGKYLQVRSDAIGIHISDL